ncbi:MAG: hypothetical protein HY690_10935 [Chloroflexi bacterium]|nr:hypothetical protein [Chloroflexota bacterium]
MEWQRSENNRREGERYERDIRLVGPRLFAAGEGGAPFEPHVRPRLSQVLAEVFAAEGELDPQADPLLADLVWWKDGQFVLAEISIVVGMSDVYRAEPQAATLRKAGQERGVESVLPVVIGQRWSGVDARKAAERLGVAWWIREDKDVSPELVAYRRLRPARS